jgi:protoheme IX farnesyltransferase
MNSGSAPTRTVSPPLRAIVTARFSDYLELTKPRIAALVMVTVTVGYVLGSAGTWSLWPLLHAMIGIGLVAASSSALNQFSERHTDARMDRTADRPLPAGRLLPTEVLLFGLTSGSLGCLYLAAFVNLTTAAICGLTWLLYVAVYTPLKRHTSLCTAVGAIPGALPPVLGWTAAGGPLGREAFALFAILFLWQFPHFLAIAWLYREQYARAGLRMLPAAEPPSRVTGFLCVSYALVLLPVSLLPAFCGLAGPSYFIAAGVLGISYAVAALRFMFDERTETARGLLWASLVYLPALLLALTCNHLQLLR